MNRITRIIAVLLLAVATTPAFAQDTDPPMSPLELGIACSPPAMLAGPPAAPLHVVASQDTVPRRLIGDRDLVVVDGGTRSGLQLGQQFYVRRPNRFGTSASSVSLGVSTLGWIRIVALNESTAIALVEHACGGIIEQDYLTPYSRPIVPAGADRDDASGEPDFTSLARVLAGDADRQASGAGDFVLIDRGAEHGVTLGTRMSVYRDVRSPGLPLASIGEAVVVSVGPSVALTRITRARDAIISGDYVAVRR